MRTLGLFMLEASANPNINTNIGKAISEMKAWIYQGFINICSTQMERSQPPNYMSKYFVIQSDNLHLFITFPLKNQMPK